LPVYDYTCEKCGYRGSKTVHYEEREHQLCTCGVPLVYVFPAPQIAAEQKRGDNRLIWHEKQVEAEHGAHWREKGTTGKEGGAGGTLYIDQGKHHA